MEAILDIPVTLTRHSALPEVDWNNLAFGKYVSDHLFTCSFKNGDWQEPQIVPYQNLSLPPTTLALHYGQSVFEGMKAFRMEDGGINIFRLEKHFERLNISLERMCMPTLPYDLFATALQQLVHVDAAWVPTGRDQSLYIRPLVFASEGKMGVKIADEYLFIVMMAPVPVLYSKPIRVKVERHFIRAAKGGTGYAKCAGNYGGSFYATQKAKQEGFDNIIWTDAFEHIYVEESGTMNLMFVLDGKLVTPPVSDTILNGVTRDALLTLASDKGIEVEERKVSVDEIITAIKEGKPVEVFGAGTAAVIAPINAIGVDGEVYNIPAYTNNSLLYRLKGWLEDLRTGRVADVYGWNTVV